MRAYELARNGKIVDLAPVNVLVNSIECTDFDLPYFTLSMLIHLFSNYNLFVLEIHCGGGTYVRSLIRDIGTELNSVAHTTELRRVQQVGTFSLF
jgi:tRNA pseudouridine55 synthase